MSAWAWIAIVLGSWVGLGIVLLPFLGRFLALSSRLDGQAQATLPAPAPSVATRPPEADGRQRVVVVDDDAPFRALVTATLAGEELKIAEAGSAAEARDLIRFWRPEVVLLDVAMPGLDGLAFCRELMAKPSPPIVVLLTGLDLAPGVAEAAGAAAVLTKPFSPLELVGLIDRLSGTGDPAWSVEKPEGDQLLVYARDLNRVLDLERAQRRLLESAYRETVTALATTLEARDTGTRLHSLRVTEYALALAARRDPSLLADPSLVYGCLLHDIGKIGVPDKILLKPAPLLPLERRIMQRHPLVGDEILGTVSLLEGEGRRIVRSHHERWDGSGYPDGLARDAIPVGARIFAVADALDAITSERPYRRAASWESALREIEEEAGRQFDPDVVETLASAAPDLHEVFDELRVAA